jgi:hypothetical protein
MKKAKTNKYKKVYIVLINYNGFQDTIECLDSIVLNTYSNYSIIIVDNNSQDDSIENLIRWGTNNASFFVYSFSDGACKLNVNHIHRYAKTVVHLICSNEIRGFAANNNIAIKFGSTLGDADLFWLLNNDTIISPDSLKELVSAIEANEKIGVTGSKLIFHDNPEKVQSLGNDNISWKGIGYGSYDGISVNKPLPVTIEMRAIVGASLLIKKSVIDIAGLMDENYYMIHEESDWCIRISRAGFILLSCSRSEVFHKEGKSTERKRKEKRFLGIVSSRTTIQDFVMWGYYSIRNEIYFVRKNYKSRYLLYLFASLIKKYLIKIFSIFLFNDDYKFHRLYLINRAVVDGIFSRMGITIKIQDWKNRFK